MTYSLIVVPFVLMTVAVVVATVRRPHFGRRMGASAIAAVILVVLTAIFDNVMIASGLVAYPEQQISGIRVGVAPIEDFSYAVCAAFLVPAAFVLLAPRRAAQTESTP